MMVPRPERSSSGSLEQSMLKGLFRVLLVSALFPTISLAQHKHVFALQFGSPVADEPFSATRTLDYEPAANSTDPVVYHAEEKVFRDSAGRMRDRKSTRLNSSHLGISYAVFCL